MSISHLLLTGGCRYFCLLSLFITAKINSYDYKDFTTSFLVDQSPSVVFNAINNVCGWWSEEIEGETEKLNDAFTYHYEDVHYAQMKLIGVIPNKKEAWLVKYNYFKFTKDKSEWVFKLLKRLICRRIFCLQAMNSNDCWRFEDYGLVVN